jgi:hypothetical protein
MLFPSFCLLVLWGSTTTVLVAQARLFEDIEEFILSPVSRAPFDFVVVGGKTPFT